jgi:Spy/CpxP family protein refolding chaperone
MRKILIITIGLMMVLTMLSAKSDDCGKCKKHSPEEHVAKLAEDLELTEEQQAAILEKMQAHHAEMEESREKMHKKKVFRKKMHKKHHQEMKAKRDAFHAEIMELLTEEQQVKFGAHIEEMESRHGHGKGRHGKGNYGGKGDDCGCRDKK